MPVARPRLGALDLLRGITVAGMIVVNNPGNWSSVFPQLTHAPWHGVTAADLIFPAFIFIMGVAMSLALVSRAAPGTRAELYRRILKRAGLLVLLGLVVLAHLLGVLAGRRSAELAARLATPALALAGLLVVGGLAGFVVADTAPAGMSSSAWAQNQTAAALIVATGLVVGAVGTGLRRRNAA